MATLLAVLEDLGFDAEDVAEILLAESTQLPNNVLLLLTALL